MFTRPKAGATAILLASLFSACTSADTNATAPSSTSATSIANSCINPTDIRRQEVVSDQEIRFELNNGEVWVNRLPRTCPGLKFQQGFSWDVRGMLVCSNQQMIRVKDDNTPCMLGEFARLPAEPPRP